MPCKAKELQPGDLFSTAGPEYWNSYDPRSIGQRVYIRTEGKPLDASEDEDMVYRIIIDRETL